MSNDTCWTCKIGPGTDTLPMGADLPMRRAVEEAYFRLTGKYAKFNFSGWGGRLDDIEQSVVDKK